MLICSNVGREVKGRGFDKGRQPVVGGLLIIAKSPGVGTIEFYLIMDAILDWKLLT